MKVEIISVENSAELTKAINEFIKDKYVYDIKYPLPFKWHRALIMYDEKLKEPEPTAVRYVQKEKIDV